MIERQAVNVLSPEPPRERDDRIDSVGGRGCRDQAVKGPGSRWRSVWEAVRSAAGEVSDASRCLVNAVPGAASRLVRRASWRRFGRLAPRQ